MYRCPDCGQDYETQQDLDDHVLAARHWDDKDEWLSRWDEERK